MRDLTSVMTDGLDTADRLVRHARVQRVGLALAGHFHGVVSERVQVFGETEITYLRSLSSKKRSEALDAFFDLNVCAVLVTGGFTVPPQVIESARKHNTPLVVVQQRTGPAIQAVEDVLIEKLAPRTDLHGVLVDVFGVGVALLGESGVGKSECALDLLLRGHRLVADDIIQCDVRPPGHVYGEAPPLLRNHLEVRGLGVLDIKLLFGVTSVRSRKRIDIVARLSSSKEACEQDRLGLEDRYYRLLGAEIRELVLPVRAGRDMATIIEIAARDELGRRAGHNSPRSFVEQFEPGYGEDQSMGAYLHERLPPQEKS